VLLYGLPWKTTAEQSTYTDSFTIRKSHHDKSQANLHMPERYMPMQRRLGASTLTIPLRQMPLSLEVRLSRHSS
jgi:hypothetical protein